MKLCFLTHRGLERYCIGEIKRKLDCVGKSNDSIVIVEAKSWNTVWKAVYFLQTPLRTCILISSFGFRTLNDIEKNAKKINIKEFCTDTTLFNTECIRQGDHDFSSEDVKAAVGSVISKNHFLNIDYKHPTVQVHIFIVNSQCYITLDLAGRDAGKRLYKVFHHTASLKGSVAASFLEFSGYTGKEVLIDPCMGSGIIPIEAALSTLCISQWYYDQKLLCHHLPQWTEFELQKNIKSLPIYGYDYQLRHVNTAQKNAKLAGIDKAVTLSKVDLEWLDTKHEEGSVDCISTHPPEPSKRRQSKEVEKIYIELFHQAEFVLKKTGVLTVVLSKPALFLQMSERHFVVLEKQSFPYGDEEKWFIKLKKKIPL